MYFDTKDKKECCACTACQQICPTKSISFVEDNEGFRYPHINIDACIKCELCRKVCPIASPQYNNYKEPIVFAAMLKEVKQRQQSSSGGLFFAIAKYVIDKGGIVYGAAFDEKLKLNHIGINSLSDLSKLRGSKYVQSDLKNTFGEIKSHLKNKTLVYFVGTGCQVAGLKAFLRRDFDNLLTSDLVCHGVPSQRLFDMHIDYLSNKYKGKISNYQFRDNEMWGVCEIFNLTNPYSNKTTTIKNPSYELSPYLYSFMYCFTYRYSCYDCKFATIPRQGDITLADYWGIKDFFPNIESKNGVSAVFINNKRGEQFWNQIKETCIYYQSNSKDVAKYNGNLIHTSQQPQIRVDIYSKINELGYETAAKKYFKSPNYYKIKFYYFIKDFPIVKPLYRLYKCLK